MNDPLAYTIIEVTDDFAEFDDDGNRLPNGWYYRFDHAGTLVGPFADTDTMTDEIEALIESIILS